jgi:hypothetical protein
MEMFTSLCCSAQCHLKELHCLCTPVKAISVWPLMLLHITSSSLDAPAVSAPLIYSIADPLHALQCMARNYDSPLMEAGGPPSAANDAASAAAEHAPRAEADAASRHPEQASSSSSSSRPAAPSSYPSAKHAEPSAPPGGLMAPDQAEASAPPMPEHVAQV